MKGCRGEIELEYPYLISELYLRKVELELKSESRRPRHEYYWKTIDQITIRESLTSKRKRSQQELEESYLLGEI